jgi:PAS domain-containing protein
LRPFFAICGQLNVLLSSFPAADSSEEQALFACATHVFLQTPEASQAQEALRGALGEGNIEQLNLILAFVRMAHYWTKLHPELAIEDDVNHLLATHEKLAACILKDLEAQNDSLSRQVTAELASLRTLQKKHETIELAYQELSIDHQYVQHSLQETGENLRKLVAVMPAGVYACDREGVITYHNRQACEFWVTRRTWTTRHGYFWIRAACFSRMGLFSGLRTRLLEKSSRRVFRFLISRWCWSVPTFPDLIYWRTSLHCAIPLASLQELSKLFRTSPS